MASSIDATKPADAVPASKSDLRANLAAAKSEIEALQTGLAALPSYLPGIRNRLLNPAMRVDRRALGTVSVTPTNKAFLVDRWQAGSEVAAGATIQLSTTAGYFNRTALRVTVTTAKVPAAADRTWIGQPIEGATMYDLLWGTSSAQSLVLTFWVRSSVAGTYSVAMQNVGNARSRVQTFAVNAINTWEQKTVTFPGDVSGTWTTATTAAWTLRFDLGSGSGAQNTAGVWLGADARTTSGSVALSSTLNATFDISDVQLEAGTVASPFERRPDTLEQQLTARYYENAQFNFAGYQTAGGTIQNFVRAQVDKRAVPTITAPGAPTNVSTPAFTATVGGFLANGTATATGSWVWTSTYVMDAELSL